MKISASILSTNERINTVLKLNKTEVDYIHIDVMDGKFVNNNQFSIQEIININEISNKKLDIHLMTENPIEYINKLNNINIEYITIHEEINKDIKELIKLIKKIGYKVGIAIKPETKVSNLMPYINDIDLVLIMSVEPGFGGQKFIDYTIQKAIEVKKINKNIQIQMDGGINNITIHKIKNIVDIAVVGSYIIKQNDYNQAINVLKN